MKTNERDNNAGQSSGRTENKGAERDEQKNSMRRTDQQERERIAGES